MKIMVIKCGGSIIHQLTAGFFDSLIDLQELGYSFVFVHGGGPDINGMLDHFGITVQFKDGLRKTSTDVLKIAEMVLAGKTNRALVDVLQKHGFASIGINGSDADLLRAKHIDYEKFGEVGMITKVNSDLIRLLIEQGLVPVLTPISTSISGSKLNVNADTAAGAVAAALRAEMCVFISDVEGIKDKSGIIPNITSTKVRELIENGTINGGMIPKVEAALLAGEYGAANILITSGKEKFYSEMKWKGTFVYKDKKVMI